MALKAPKGTDNKSFAPQDNLEPGTYKARLVQLIDLGLQPQRPYQGQEKPPAYEIMTTYELVDEFMKDERGEDIEDKPRWISESFPLHSLKSEKAKSTKRYEAFDKDHEFEGDFTKCMALPVLVTIVNNKNGDKVYDNIATTSPMRAKDVAGCPALVNPPKTFDLSDPSLEVFQSLLQWLQDRIKGNLEYKGSKLENLLQDAPDKDGKGKAARVQPDASQEDKPWDDDDKDSSPY